jgi:hypothetical protein
MQIEGRKWKLFGSTPPDSDGDDSSNGLRRAEPMLYESRADGSVLVGLACWAGPQYPNGELLTHCKHTSKDCGPDLLNSIAHQSCDS